MPQQTKNNPLSTLQMALQLQEIMRRQQMGPEEDLLKYRQFLPHLGQLPENEAGRSEEAFLNSSRADRGRAANVKAEYTKGLSADALNDLEGLEALFQSQQEQAMARLAKVAETPGVDFEALYGQTGMDLAQRRARQFQDFAMKHRGAMRDPAVQKAIKEAESLYGPEGTKFNFATAMMQGAMGPKAFQARPNSPDQTALGGDIVKQTQKRLPLYQALQGITPGAYGPVTRRSGNPKDWPENVWP